MSRPYLLLKSVQCHKNLPPTFGDRIRITVISDGIAAEIVEETVSPPIKIPINRRISFSQRIEIKLDNIEGPPIGLGMFVLLPNSDSRTQVLGLPNCRYEFSYEIGEDIEDDVEEKRSLKEIDVCGNKRYIIADLVHDLSSLYANQGDLPVPLQNLNELGSPFVGAYIQEDPDYENGCGPVAGNNLLDWYSKSTDDWEMLRRLMKTGTWDEEMVIPLAILNPGLLACIGLIVTSLVNAGTLPANLVEALKQLAPAQHQLVYEHTTMRLNKIRNLISKGTPVVVLYTTPGGLLHWAVVTGFYWRNHRQYVRIANDSDKPLDLFTVCWQLNQLDSVARDFIGLPPFEIKRCTMIYYT